MMRERFKKYSVMKNSKSLRFLFLGLLLLSTILSIAQAAGEWDQKKAAEWFKKREWLTATVAAETSVKYDAFGRTLENAVPDTNFSKPAYLQLEKLKPHKSINTLEFAKQYHAQPLWWSKAFAFLKETDLATIKPGKYLIDGDNVFATITEGPPKQSDTTKWESHRIYQDIHYVVKGKEKIGIAPISSATIINDYNNARDLLFYSAEGRHYTADTSNLFIFFPADAHRPNLAIKGQDKVKKIVIKIRRSDL